MLSTVNWTKKKKNNSGLGKSLIPVNGHNNKLSSYPIDWSSLGKFPFTVDSDGYRDPQLINKQRIRDSGEDSVENGTSMSRLSCKAQESSWQRKQNDFKSHRWWIFIVKLYHLDMTGHVYTVARNT